jgi:hypothetical protein
VYVNSLRYTFYFSTLANVQAIHVIFQFTLYYVWSSKLCP